jgi:hypothetical protein
LVASAGPATVGGSLIGQAPFGGSADQPGDANASADRRGERRRFRCSARRPPTIPLISQATPTTLLVGGASAGDSADRPDERRRFR